MLQSTAEVILNTLHRDSSDGTNASDVCIRSMIEKALAQTTIQTPNSHSNCNSNHFIVIPQLHHTKKGCV